MLREIHIKNIAVIEDITIELNEGFQALTGETGAGKSILIDSINMALGGRSSKELIRTGAEFASVDLAFDIEDDRTISALEELGVDCEEGVVVISRKLTADGKSRCHINGRVTSLVTLREVGEMLLAIHGQNDNQSILSPKSHIGFLDDFANTRELLLKYKMQYDKLREIKRSIAELESDENEKIRLVELLKFQTDEIDAAHLKPGEEDELLERRIFLQNAEQIASSAGGAYYALYGGDDSAEGACDSVAKALRLLETVRGYDAKISSCHETLSSVMADLEDITHELRNYVEGVEYSPEELDETEGRLSLIGSLKRKYGKSIEEVLEYAEKSRARLLDIERSDERKTELEAARQIETEQLKELANELSDMRLKASLLLQERVMDELSDLDMQKVRFSVGIASLTDESGLPLFTPVGCDRVEFMISANPGEDLKPLAKIASGGEMSRIMLAIKSVLSDADAVGTLIFDEIDSGVSGRAAQKIAEKMGMLAKRRQIICITHLAQLAAMADYQYLIEKSSDSETTRTTVRLVMGDERKTELARIIGGVKVTELTLSAAQEMLDLAESYKN